MTRKREIRVRSFDGVYIVWEQHAMEAASEWWIIGVFGTSEEAAARKAQK